MIYLDPQWLTLVRALLKQYVPDCEVWVFGSRATGNIKPFSDLDLAILPSALLGRGDLIDLKEAFEVSDLPIRVDVLDFEAVSPEFQGIIKQSYRVLQEKSPL
jgi:type I restriction enzyme S subunit